MKWLTIAVLLFAASPAFADAAPDDPVWPWTPSDPSSYRLEVVAVDATAVAGVAIGHNSTAVIGLSIATYALGAPILHLVHHRPGNALGSFLLRVALPVAGGALGWMLTSGVSGPDIPSGAGGAVIGLVAGVITASSIDIGVLSRAEPAPQLAPAVTPTANGGMTFGLTGSF
jgi:membrane associated rhomboid family serine protease